MKITIIKNYLIPYNIGGAEINVQNIIDDFTQRKEIDILSVITMDRNPWPKKTVLSSRLCYYKFFPINLYFNYPLEKKRNIVFKILWRIIELWNPWTFIQAIRILKKERPDVVQLHNFYGLSISIVSAIQFLKIPMVFVPHDFYLTCKNSSHMKKHGTICTKQCLLCSMIAAFNRFVIRKPITTFFLSEYSATILRRHQPQLRGAVMHNPCMISRAVIQDNVEFRKVDDVTSDSTVKFLFAGRLERAKGILTVLSAIDNLKEKNVRFSIAGAGASKRIVEEFCAKSETTKYLGFISGDMKHQCFLSHDIFIFASEWFEVSPLTICEANAYGMPVLASNVGSVPEHIVQKKNGFLFDAGDSKDLSEKIAGLARNKKEVLSMRKHCFDAAISNSPSAFFDKMVRVLEETARE